MNLEARQFADVGWGDSLFASFSGTAAHADPSDDAGTALVSMRERPESVGDAFAGIYLPVVPTARLKATTARAWPEWAKLGALVVGVFLLAVLWREVRK